MTPEQRFKCMSHNRAKNTGPELSLRYALWHQGFRYRINDKRLPGRPDIVLPKYRTVIFVHGCFWHGHKNCKNYTVPKTNTEFWVAKVARNQERDQEVWRQLEANGWNVIIVWECQITKATINAVVTKIEKELRNNRSSYMLYQEERKKSRAAYLEERKRKKNIADSVTAELSH
jgi:DNA mismatch endonuclease (patch repair protein)